MISWFFIGLVITILLTPGPTNTLLASSGIQVGLRQSLLLIPAEAVGYIIAITAWGMLIGKVSATFPLLPTFLKLLSAAYIIFLAIKLWRTANQDVVLNQPTIRPKELLCATLLNPKALLFASAIFPAAAWKSQDIYLAHMGTFVALILPIALFWISVGAMLASKKVNWLSQAKLQRTACVVLVSFAIPISYSALNNL
ncbi:MULTISPECIES: LysE family translocator [Acinetobacter]|jgi:threonine/homoserine/homoserine lactone efflux protein|uniref:LysE family translocator n=1 Tax=Acinetobacter TaxID=469 RepID=UPI0004470782|nr:MULTISPECIES: LysE family translocator [Acinetobacter]EXB49599.1 lysE type translocator family protein [Acinetobacter baumannii 146457]EYT15903.1 lysE type translocator family protein [Acinetobacter sp. 1000160]MCU4368776.1 LysE family translocator [Acinetobacter courvalinii]MCU4446980.1 LysE family translocator [Acinetobacter courvalinii]